MVLNFAGARLRRLAAALATATAAALAGCGGGDLVEPFAPTRQLSFGDEYSAMTADGHNWGINAVDATSGAFQCATDANWVVRLAGAFGMAFTQCNPSGLPVNATLYAAPNARLAEVQAQVQAHIDADRAAGTGDADGFGPKDMVTILVGRNDVLEQYAAFVAAGADAAAKAAAAAVLEARGKALGELVNGIADADGRVLIATVPDLGLTPFAVAEEAAAPGRARVLTDLTAAFNSEMRATLRNDGRRIGLVLADELTQSMSKFPATFGLADVKTAACTVAPPDCTTATLVSGANASNWLWAAPTLYSAGGQLRLAQIAESRARNNPF